jgi:hypothetical protein
LAAQTLTNAPPCGSVSAGIETGDVGHEADPKHLGAICGNERGRRADARGA